MLSDAAFYEKVFNATGDGIYVTDRDGVIVKVNKTLVDMLGFSEDELLGRSSSEVMPSAYTNSSYYSHEKDVFKPDYLDSYIAQYKHRDGSSIPVEGRISLLQDTGGNYCGIVGVIRDITARSTAETIQKESEQRFRAIAASAFDAIISIDDCDTIIYWNTGAERIFGYHYTEVIGKPVHMLLPEAVRSPEQIGFPGINRTGSAADEQPILETVFQRKNASHFLAEQSVSLWNQKGRTFATAIIRDITERKRAEQALKETNAYINNLIASSLDCIVTTNSDGLITRANKSFLELVGYGPEEVVGKSLQLFYPQEHTTYECSTGTGISIDEHYINAISEKMLLLSQQGKVSNVFSYCIKKNGRAVPIEQNIVSLYDEQSHVIGTLSIIRDITERKIADLTLRESEQKYRALADSLPQIVFEVDLTGLVTFVNKNAFEAFGYTTADFKAGLKAMHMIVPEDRSRVKETFRQIVAGEYAGGNEYTALRKDGTTFACLIHAAPIITHETVTGARGIIINIEDRKKIEAEILKARRLESIASLAGGVAQDFNTILSTVLGNINIAQHYIVQDDQLSEPLLVAERATLRAKDLTDQLFMFSRGAASSKAIIHLEELLEESAAYALKGSQVQSSFMFAPDLWPVNVDASQIRLVCINLIINADHAMPEGGLLTISAENTLIGPEDRLALEGGSYVRIAIKDESIGILNEHLQQIFDPYFTSIQRGSGIGLATAYIVVKNHGGLISVESEFGSGTTFYIYLPAKMDA